MLTIGSIIYLKEGSQKLMILNRGPILRQNDENVMYDYSACLYPHGLDQENIFYFNEENVDKVLFKGFEDEDEARLQELFEKWKEDNKDNFKRGNVDKAI